MPYINYQDRQISYEIQRGNRKKTIALQVTADIVTVRVPRRLSDAVISQFMTKKARWIYDRQLRIRQDPLSRIGNQYITGERFPYLGHAYTLLVVKDADIEVPVCRLWRGRMEVCVPRGLTGETAKAAVKAALITWYQGQAVKKIAERLPVLAGELGVRPASVVVKDQKSQWGSCSRSGAVRFNWKIIMAPAAILDYIIAHELCHLIHNHHKAQFWEKVESVIPDYRERKNWLREHSILITGLS